MAWDRMSVPRKFSGVGFKRLREFNIALLAKQGWHFSSNPSSLPPGSLRLYTSRIVLF